MTRCNYCRLEVLDLDLDPNNPLDRDIARLHDWLFKRWNGRWVPTCPTCQEVTP